MIDTQALADFGSSFLAHLAARIERAHPAAFAELAITRESGTQVADAVADAVLLGTGVLARRDGRLERIDPRKFEVRVGPDTPLPLVELEVAGRDLRPGDRLAGGQVADGAGLEVYKVLTPENPDDETLTLLLADGRPFVIDPDRLFRVRRLAL